MNNHLEIVVLETSDIHGNIFPLNYGSNQTEQVGLAKIASLIKREREEHEHVLLIDNGDLIQGTPLAYHAIKMASERPNPLIQAANELQYDAAVFGNHEFNYGTNVLEHIIEQANFPWLSANLLDEKTGEPYFGKPYMIQTVGGVKVGILGLTTSYIPNWEEPAHITGIQFADPVETAKQWVTHLREREGADLLIVSYHGGFERDPETGEPTEMLTGENKGYELCMEVEGIDVLLTGHQHRQLAGTKINGVLIVQPGHMGQTLGKVTLQLEDRNGRWAVVQKTSELLSVNGVEPDESILKLASTYEEATQEWLDTPIGHIEGDMVIRDAVQTRLQDNPLVEFINRVQMEVTKVTISNTAIFSNQSPGLPENVTMRDIVANYIYPNTLKVLRISGQDMKDALERSAAYFKQYDGGTIEVSPSFLEPKPQHYNYDMWEGIDYIINISKPVGERIVQLEHAGKPVDMSGEYDVVMNNYRAGGGGDYLMYQNKPVVQEVPTDVSELLANYFLEHKTVTATCNHNWKVIHD
ncbi:bifunctional UDP-sugar hydrolase/5'-nucleotidase [Sporosarcina sp. Te-1]|uniref:bifunctional metallophosphatase/5'-nucleotidase n=1 Tax=Sporosarcina sp. Te-1 TaxID=2818390 RepID=UPI001A9F7097|nr:bifunctional UDP-sugar hydrolase/5'-nucleotidase [Sporosarcina sp. Te-1]QTD39945.1 bifunctional metallophosphatase/5'-nucleotidase [Sporosarcina sp. Te-1]